MKTAIVFAYHDYGQPNGTWDRHCGLVDIAQGKRTSYNTLKNYQRAFSVPVTDPEPPPPPPPGDPEPVGGPSGIDWDLAFNDDQDELRVAMNRALIKMKKNGQYQRLVSRWGLTAQVR